MSEVKNKTEDVKNEDVKNEDVKNEDVKNEDIKNEDVKNEEVKKEDVKNTDAEMEEKVEPLVDNMPEKKKAGRMVLMVAGIVLGVLLLVYFGAVLYFQSHYQVNTRLERVDFSGKTVEEAEKLLREDIEGYSLTLTGRDGYSEAIKGTDIELVHKNEEDMRVLLKEQNAFLWFMPLITGEKADFELKVSYSEARFTKVVDALACFDEARQTEPVAATLTYDGAEFQIQEEVLGAKIDKEAFVKNVSDSISTLAANLDMEQAGCYVAPAYTKDSQEVLDTKDTVNAWIQSCITYSADGEEVVADASKIAEWVKFNEQMEPTLNAKKVKAFVATLGETYNSTGKTLKITTPTGKKAKVSGGTYGMKVDEDAEYKALVKEIKAGTVTTREPNYSQKIAGTKDEPWGDTYLEVDLTEQHMWYVQKGEVTFESDVVTGVPIPQKRTPQGVYSVLEKKRNKVLRGEIQPNGKPEYVTPVAYWMRVTWTGIGFHDATWQRKFGGQRYKQGYGSHGCINMPYSAIKELYDMVDKGCPIVVHN